MSAGREVAIRWRGQRARAYVPALLRDRDLGLDVPTATRTGTAVANLRNAAAALPPDTSALVGLLARAEGVASSFIEGVRAPVVDVVLAVRNEAPSRHGRTPAAWVAANLAAAKQAVDAAFDDPLSVDLLCAWHRTLMTGSPTPQHGVGRLRTEQGWIGGTSPLDAHLVTPPPELVPDLVGDLVDYANQEDPDPVAQAAVAHAQLEIIHPFGDGNGRVGRILVSWLLARRLGLVTPPPMSTRIAADIGGYTSGLTLYRLGDHLPWIRWFADTVSAATDAQQELVRRTNELHADWTARLRQPASGRAVRTDALAWQVLPLLQRNLVLSADTVAAELARSPQAARAALRALERAGVVQRHTTDGPRRRGRPPELYVSIELLGLIGTPVG